MKNSTGLLKYHPSTVQIFASIKRLDQKARSFSFLTTNRSRYYINASRDLPASRPERVRNHAVPGQ